MENSHGCGQNGVKHKMIFSSFFFETLGETRRVAIEFAAPIVASAHQFEDKRARNMVKTFLFLAGMLLCLGEAIHAEPLEGCAEVQTLVSSLAEVIQKWEGLTREQLAEVWPFQLFPQDCSPERPEECIIFATRGRVIGGENECIERFIWDREGIEGYRLDHLTVIYSVKSFREAERIGKRLSRVINPPDSAIRVTQEEPEAGMKRHYSVAAR